MSESTGGNVESQSDVGTEAPADDGLIYIDPGSVSRSDSGTGGYTSGGRRGRKPGSKNKPKEDSASLRGVEIAPILVSIHALLAARFGEHWSLDEPESKQLEKSIKNALRHQDMQITQKQLDYAMLVYVLAQVYGSRMVTSVMVARAKGSQSDNATYPPPNVTPFRAS